MVRTVIAAWAFAVLPWTARAAPGLIWPTPNDAFMRGLGVEAFVQPTVSGRTESGLFGCVRNGGSKFHEGLDLFPVRRTRDGRSADPAYAVLPGTVVYVNDKAGASNYGRYVVIVHDGEEPAFHTLYAHLATIGAGIRPGAKVDAAAVVGIIGNTPSHIIPVSRSHLHFEMGFKLTDDFQSWYDRQKFGSPNRHGRWNGMNLVGIDPLEYYTAYRDGEVRDMLDFLRRSPAVAKVRVRSGVTPSFIRNYPAFLTAKPAPGRTIAGWEIVFDRFGIPKAWTPLYAGDLPPGPANEVRLIEVNPRLVREGGCRPVVVRDKEDRAVLASGTLRTVRKIFGFR